MPLEMPNVGELANETGEETAPVAPEPTAPVETAPPAPPAEDLFEVKIDGKLYRVPKSEVIAGYQRQQDYTRKTMTLAEQRQAWENERKQIYEQVEELKVWLKNPVNLRNYMAELSKQQGFEDPDMPLTAAQAQQLVEARLKQEREAWLKQQDAKSEETITKVQATQYLNEINATIKGLLDTYPELKAVDGIDALLYKDVAAMDPQSFDEAKQGFAKAAETRANKMRSHFSEQLKVKAVSSNKLAQGIEPPGSAGVPTTPQPKFKLGTSDLMKQVLADLNAGEVK